MDIRILFLVAILTAFPAVFPAGAQDGAAAARLVQAAADIRGIERRLQTLEGQLAQLEVRRESLEKDYTQRREAMAATLAALSRMGRTPREAVLIRPGGPLQAARTTMLLSASIPAIESEAEAARVLLNDLERTRAALAEKTGQARTARTSLAERHRALNALMDARAVTGAPAGAEEERQIAALAREARNLRDLLGALDQSLPAGTGTANPALIVEGDGQLPVSGIIRVGYGQRDDTGMTSAGLSIETLAGSVVVAPLGGIVRYAGPFRGYGNIIIIAHTGGYHSLVAGLDKISVKTGQMIVSGEPIAILDANTLTNQTATAGRRIVYYELRQAGTPVNPSRKLPAPG